MMMLCGSPVDFLTSRKPSAPAPPPLLTVIIGCFIRLFLATTPWMKRAIWSAPPPVPAGMMNCTGLVGSQRLRGGRTRRDTAHDGCRAEQGHAAMRRPSRGLVQFLHRCCLASWFPPVGLWFCCSSAPSICPAIDHGGPGRSRHRLGISRPCACPCSQVTSGQNSRIMPSVMIDADQPVRPEDASGCPASPASPAGTTPRPCRRARSPAPAAAADSRACVKT